MARIDLDRASDYVGAHVRMDWRGRTLLGEIVNVRRAADWRGPTLTVRFFNREPWPCHPLASDVDVLERDWEETDDG